MRKYYAVIIAMSVLSLNSAAQMHVPKYYSGGPFGLGSWLQFDSGGDEGQTSIQENWGLNLTGSAVQPVKIYNTSLLVGFQSGGQNYGLNNLLVSGNAGIGTLTPNYKLTVNGNFISSTDNGNNYFSYNGAADLNFRFAGRGSGGRALVHYAGNVLALNFDGDFNGGTSIGKRAMFPEDVNDISWVKGKFNVDPLGAGGIVIGNPSVQSGGYTSLLLNVSDVSNGYSSIQSIKSSGSAYGVLALNPFEGNVGIGTTTPNEKLSVNGNIRSKEVKVETANWPDYVFKKDYELMPLSQIKTYIEKNSHLPEIPSASEIEKNGISLGEMNKLLAKKLEELTLHLIEKDSELSDQKAVLSKEQMKNLRQEDQLQAQQSRLDKLEAQLTQLLQSKSESKP